MDIAEDRCAPRIRERPAKPLRRPWTFRCGLAERDVALDVDAFDCDEAVSLAAAHWDGDPDAVDAEGRRRSWMRWIGISTHEPWFDSVAVDRGWWLWSKLALGFVVVAAVSWPIGSGVGDALREHRELSLEVKRAELDRLQGENAALAVEAAVDNGGDRR